MAASSVWVGGMGVLALFLRLPDDVAFQLCARHDAPLGARLRGTFGDPQNENPLVVTRA